MVVPPVPVTMTAGEPPACGAVPLTLQPVNPRQSSESLHVLAGDRYRWWTRQIEHHGQKYVQNPTPGNLDLLNDILMQFRDVFVSVHFWVHDA